MNPLPLHQLLKAIDGVPVGLPSLVAEATRISIDSRKIRPGDIFWALRGETHDGHDFTSNAFRAGALACVISKEHAGTVESPAIVVDDTLAALSRLAAWHRREQSATIIGVTGSVGKTTTRNLIHNVLGTAFPGVESPANFNNHFGLPLSLLGISSHDRYAVMEMGASHVGEIRDLAAVAKPEIGVVTAVEMAHVGEFGSLDHITIAKGELVEALPKDGLAVLAGDDPRVRGMAGRTKARVLLVGEGPDNDLHPVWVRSTTGRLSFRLDAHDYTLAASGRHLLNAALIAVALGREFGLSSEQIADGLSRFKVLPGRGEIRRFGALTVIDDTYNANPGSMRAAIHVLRDWAGPGRCILVVGDMLELGSYSAGCHRLLGEEAAACGIHGIIAMGQQAPSVAEGAVIAGHPSSQASACTQIEEVTEVLQQWLQPGDVVLVKGSRGMRMERVVGWLESVWGIPHREPAFAQRVA